MSLKWIDSRDIAIIELCDLYLLRLILNRTRFRCVTCITGVDLKILMMSRITWMRKILEAIILCWWMRWLILECIIWLLLNLSNMQTQLQVNTLKALKKKRTFYGPFFYQKWHFSLHNANIRALIKNNQNHHSTWCSKTRRNHVYTDVSIFKSGCPASGEQERYLIALKGATIHIGEGHDVIGSGSTCWSYVADDKVSHWLHLRWRLILKAFGLFTKATGPKKRNALEDVMKKLIKLN